MRRLSIIVALAGLAAALTGAQAQQLTEEQTLSADEFAVNNTWFVLYHELGHMLIHQFGIPVLGKEEDAVDNIATYSLLAQQSPEADQALTDAIYGWELADSQVEEFEVSDFYDEHSLDLQRAYGITCLLVGSDPDGFADAANYMEMDPDRQESCGFDFAQVEASISALLQPYLGTDQPISVVYEDGGEVYGWAEEALKASGVLELAATDISASFALPRPITIRATQCGEPNAFYDPETEEVSICYELVDMYFGMIAEDMLMSDEEDAPQG
ncbi:MAG: DUF4344 domain-containing metallopeptidase [Alphaproteobacteria bacterium]|nr:DUF4344 domain-containing metallopeptidase [Alphaproteobacteria bacterium]